MRCVRGGQLIPSDLNRSGEIVTDNTTTLQWQDDANVKTITKTWMEAINYCENTLALGGHTDWRLPNKKELLSITDHSRYDPTIDTSVFTNTASSNYWSSTTSANDTESVWVVHFDSATSNYHYKTEDYYVRCVRGGEFAHLTCPEEQHLIQGERVCVPGTPESDPDPYPNMEGRNYIQGDINTGSDRTEDPGWQDPYPSAIECPPGKAVAQGTGECTV